MSQPDLPPLWKHIYKSREMLSYLKLKAESLEFESIWVLWLGIWHVKPVAISFRVNLHGAAVDLVQYIHDLSCHIYLSVDTFPRSCTPFLSLNVKTGSRLVSLLVSFGVPHQCQSECLIAFQCHLVPNRCCRQICHCSNFSRAVL